MNNSADQTIQRLETAISMMRRAVMSARERLGSNFQLTRTQLEILVILADNPGQTTSELARRLFLTQSAVTQTIETLVRRDLIDRRPDERDRRVIRLRLSSGGEGIADNVRALRRKNMQALVERLSEAEIDVMITATEKFAALLEDAQYPQNH